MGRVVESLPRQYVAPPEAVPALGSVPSLGGRIPSLDGLRALSILFVVVAHARTTTSMTFEFRRWATAIPGNGQLGVSIFFVISGFLITHLLIRERETKGRIDVKHFYVRRAFRILPAYFSFLFALWVLRHRYGLFIPNRNFIAAALFVTNYSPIYIPNWIGHTWSLNVEEQFYLIWPALLVPLGWFRARWVAVALIAFAAIIRPICWLALPPDSIFVTRMGIMLHTRMDSLMFGCLAAMLYASPRFQEFIQRIFRSKLHIVAFIFLFLIAPYLATWRERPYFALGGYTIEGACITLLIIWAVQHPTQGVGRWLNQPLIVHLGVVSYSLYLWQQLFLNAENHTWTGRFPLNLLFALLAAEFSYWVIERTFLNLRTRLTGHRRYEEPQAVRT